MQSVELTALLQAELLALLKSIKITLFSSQAAQPACTGCMPSTANMQQWSRCYRKSWLVPVNWLPPRFSWTCYYQPTSALCTKTPLWYSGVRYPLPCQSAWMEGEELDSLSSRYYHSFWSNAGYTFNYLLCGVETPERQEIIEDSVVRFIYLCIYLLLLLYFQMVQYKCSRSN